MQSRQEIRDKRQTLLQLYIFLFLLLSHSLSPSLSFTSYACLLSLQNLFPKKNTISVDLLTTFSADPAYTASMECGSTKWAVCVCVHVGNWFSHPTPCLSPSRLLLLLLQVLTLQSLHLTSIWLFGLCLRCGCCLCYVCA